MIKKIIPWHHYEQQVHLSLNKHKKLVPLHTHFFDEICFVLSGSCIHGIGKDKYPLIRGDVFVVKEGQMHRFIKNRNVTVANLEYKWEHFGYLEKEFSDLSGFKALFFHEPLFRKHQKFKAKLHLSDRQLKEVFQLLVLIREEEIKKRSSYDSMLESLFKIVVITICRYYTEAKKPYHKSLLKISSAINYIETNFTEKISRHSLARKVEMNFNTFCKVFKETTGCSPIDYLIRFRIERAVEMMENDNTINVTETAINCGFESNSYFSKKFKQLIGVTPMKYLKNLRLLESENYSD